MTEAACPDPALLRALVEPEALAGLLPGGAAEAARAHALACPRCQKRLALAKREEESLRGLATPVAADPRALEATLAAVRDAAANPGKTTPSGSRPASGRALPSRRQRSAPGARRSIPWGALGAALGTGLLALALFRASAPHETPVLPESSPEPTSRPSAVPAPTPSRATTPPPVRPSPVASPEAGDVPEVELSPIAPTPGPGGEPVAPGASPAPDQDPIALAPTPAPGATPADATTGGRTLARAGSLGLLVKGRELSVGEALPEGATIEVKTAGARVESEGVASLLLAQHTSLTLERGGDGGASFVLASGKALVTTTGSSPWSVGTSDVYASLAPTLETAARPAHASAMFVVAVESAGATFTTIDGGIRVDSRRPGATDVSMVLAAGFSVSSSKGKLREAAQPVDATRALEWVPKKQRPASLPPLRRVVRTLDAATDKRLVTDGTLSPADATSARPFLAGAPNSYDQKFVRWSDKAPSLARVDPAMLVEVTVRVSRKATVSVMVFDDTANENFEWTSEVAPGRWVTVVAPLGAFANKAKAPRLIQKDDVVHALVVGAGPDSANVELSVQGARFLAER